MLKLCMAPGSMVPRTGSTVKGESAGLSVSAEITLARALAGRTSDDSRPALLHGRDVADSSATHGASSHSLKPTQFSICVYQCQS